MPKKLAVGARKAGMKGKKSASKRELIEAGEDKATSRRAPATEDQEAACLIITAQPILS